VGACIVKAARQHFETTLRAPSYQPDCMIMHLEFPQRTSSGPARVVIREIKRGRQTSVVQATLEQAGRAPVVGFLTHVNIAAEQGLTLRTDWAPEPAPPAVDLAALAADADANWALTPAPNPQVRLASQRVHMYTPRTWRARRAVMDHWVRLASGEPWTDDALAFVADISLQVVEGYEGDEQAATEAGLGGSSEVTGNWYPTLALNLEVKKNLPREGVEWLYVRVAAKSIRNGRMDLEVFIMDAQGELVALSHHVGMIVSISRNYGKRGDAGTGGGGDSSKL
jgi:hypothetical protein